MRPHLLHVVFAVIFEAEKYMPHLSRRIGTRARMHSTRVRCNRNWTHPRRRTDVWHEAPASNDPFIFGNEWPGSHDPEPVQRDCIQHGAQHRPMAEKLRRTHHGGHVSPVVGKIWWRFVWRRTTWIWVWVWRWRLMKHQYCKCVAKPQPWFSQNKKPQKRDMHATRRPPKTAPKTPKAFFRKQETPKKGHARARLVPFGTDPHKWGLPRVHAFLTIYALAKMAQKSSANYLVPRVFSQKGFDISIFGHFFCPIPEIFLTLVQSKSKK